MRIVSGSFTRRRALCTIAAAATGVVSGDALAQGMQNMPGMRGQPMTLQECVADCLRTHASCIETARYCLDNPRVGVTPVHLSLLTDCAEICQTTANFLIRRSVQHGTMCRACADVCDACAAECEKFASDAQMAGCARTCRECAKSCRDMVNVRI